MPLLMILAGLTAGFLAWFVAGGPQAAAAKLDAAEGGANGLRRPRPTSYAPPGLNVADLAARPLFILTTGPGAVPEPAVRLDGVVKARGRVAALVSLNDKPPEWLTVGEAREGVTLLEVHGSKVVVDTVYGPKDVALGTRIGPSASAAATAAPALAASPSAGAAPSAGPVQPTIVDQIPPGFRSPPPPASAPAPR